MRQKRAKEILEKNKEDWDVLADEFSQTRHNLWLEFDDLKSYVKEGDRVLDLGCGNGRLYNLFKDKRVEYTGVDASERLIEIAKKKFETIGTRPKFIVGDALNLPFKDNEFNVIFAIAFLHHLPCAELRLKVLKKCYQSSRANSFFIVTVWNFYQPGLIRKYKIWKILFGFKNIFIPFNAKDRKVERYYYAFTKRGLTKTVKRAGFKIIKCYYIKKGQKTSRLKGYNLVLIAEKDGQSKNF